MNHPGDSVLALLAGDELRVWQRWKVTRHVDACARCTEAVAELRLVRELVGELGGVAPPGIEWQRLAGEMTANIRLGLAAGEAIARFDRPGRLRRPASLGWHAAAVLACASMIVVATLWLKLPDEQTRRLSAAIESIRFPGDSMRNSSGVLLEASPSALGVRSYGREMSFVLPKENVTVLVSTQGSAGVQFVDGDTGQVTINQVYYAH